MILWFFVIYDTVVLRNLWLCAVTLHSFKPTHKTEQCYVLCPLLARLEERRLLLCRLFWCLLCLCAFVARLVVGLGGTLGISFVFTTASTVLYTLLPVHQRWSKALQYAVSSYPVLHCLYRRTVLAAMRRNPSCATIVLCIRIVFSRNHAMLSPGHTLFFSDNILLIHPQLRRHLRNDQYHNFLSDRYQQCVG